VIVVSSLPINVLDALNAGAVDFVKKPNILLPDDLKSFIMELSTKIKIASVAHIGKTVAITELSPLSSLTNSSSKTVIAIGASTGGTEAILSVIRDLPSSTPGIVIVQHMPATFTKMYAERIDKIVNMRVKEAADNDRLENGVILIAAGENHLTLCRDKSGYYVKSTPGSKVSGHCPSVDVLFESVALTAKNNAVGIILTGMGGDGANGLLKMRQAGAHTIGQNKESCVVYGMPMVAYNIGAVTKQLALENISAEIIRYLNTK
ncbi:MAG: chemotaxis protein CheB, partial [Oscillospiraceae bacterium]